MLGLIPGSAHGTAARFEATRFSQWGQSALPDCDAMLHCCSKMETMIGLLAYMNESGSTRLQTRPNQRSI